MFYSTKELWSSAEVINFINDFCCNLCCITLLLCYAQRLILETVVLIFVYCIGLSSFVLFVCSVFPDKFHVRLSYDRIMDLQNDIYIYMYVCMYVCNDDDDDDDDDDGDNNNT